MFSRPHHQRIAHVLSSLDAQRLRGDGCYFGGGTAMALMHGEYRESVDIDFLVSQAPGYRNLRQMMTGPKGVNAIVREGAVPLVQAREIRADQYGIRTMLLVDGTPIKFEVILEGRIELAEPRPADSVCGVSTLTPLDMVASKLLANCDRWADDGVFSRDLIDLAMMSPTLRLMRLAVAKAELAYGASVLADLAKAIDRLGAHPGWLERCTRSLAMDIPRALLWQKVRALAKVLPKDRIPQQDPE